MELEIGMYVRTLRGKIWIIISKQAISGHKKDILKASYNIIDLIEVGDYVNGIKVTSVNKTVEGNVLIGLGDMFGFSKFDNDYQIKSIVTKEQYESVEYKVEREEN